MLSKGYVDTSLGLLPKEWKFLPISKIGEVVTGRTPSTKIPEYYGGKYKLISPANLGESTYVETAHRWLTEEGLAVSRILPKDTVLVSCIGYIGKAGLTSDEKSATNQQINAVICSPKISPHFLYFLITHWKAYIETFARVTTVPILNKTNFEAIELPIPPLSEQQAIAHVLSTVRQAIEATERVIAAARELKRSMMKHLFTYGPVPVHKADQVPLKDTEIGEVPEGWDVSNLEYAVNLRKEIVLPEDYPHLRYVGLEHLESGENQIKTFGAASDVKSSKHRFYPLDNLYGKLRPYLDKCAQAEWEGMSSTDILILTPNEEILISGYLVNLMHTGSYLNYAKSTTSGTNLPRTSWSSMKKFQFGLPSLEEQVVSVNFLQKVGHKITVEENRKYALEYLFNSLLHNLMTGKVRVDYD